MTLNAFSFLKSTWGYIFKHRSLLVNFIFSFFIINLVTLLMYLFVINLNFFTLFIGSKISHSLFLIKLLFIIFGFIVFVLLLFSIMLLLKRITKYSYSAMANTAIKTIKVQNKFSHQQSSLLQWLGFYILLIIESLKKSHFINRLETLKEERHLAALPNPLIRLVIFPISVIENCEIASAKERAEMIVREKWQQQPGSLSFIKLYIYAVIPGVLGMMAIPIYLTLAHDIPNQLVIHMLQIISISLLTLCLWGVLSSITVLQTILYYYCKTNIIADGFPAVKIHQLFGK